MKRFILISIVLLSVNNVWAIDYKARSSFTGRPISVEFAGTELDAALRILSEIGKFNYILPADLGNRRVNLRVTDVPWDQVLQLILRQHNLDMTIEPNQSLRIKELN